MNETSKRQRQDATTGVSSCIGSQQQQQQRRRRRPRDDDGSIHLAVKGEKEDQSNVDNNNNNNNKGKNDDTDDDSNSTMIPIRDCTRLYCSAATLHCARQQHCIPCAYKIACFDVALDTSFCRAIPNQRPETCPRTTTPHHASLLSSSCVGHHHPGQEVAVAVAAEMGTLGYQPHYRILTIGDGDFSFSLALAFMLQRHQQQQQQQTAKNHGNVARRKANSSATAASGLTATSFESKETLETVYGPEMMKRIQLLGSMGVHILYQVDGTKLTPEIFSPQQQQGSDQQSSPPRPRFHRIVWNFPCSAIQKGQDGQNQEMEYNKTLIRDFVAGAVPLLHPANGQIHINHKTKPPFNQWQIQDVALAAPLSGDDRNNNDHQRNVYYWGRVVLDRALFPPYVPRKALHSKSFPVHDACTYIFGHTANNSNANTCRGLDADVLNLDLDDDDDAAATNDGMTLSASALVPVTRPLILSLRRHLLQSIMPSRNKNQKSKSNRKKKKQRTH